MDRKEQFISGQRAWTTTQLPRINLNEHDICQDTEKTKTGETPSPLGRYQDGFSGANQPQRGLISHLLKKDSVINSIHIILSILYIYGWCILLHSLF